MKCETYWRAKAAVERVFGRAVVSEYGVMAEDELAFTLSGDEESE